MSKAKMLQSAKLMRQKGETINRYDSAIKFRDGRFYETTMGYNCGYGDCSNCDRFGAGHEFREVRLNYRQVLRAIKNGWS